MGWYGCVFALSHNAISCKAHFVVHLLPAVKGLITLLERPFNLIGQFALARHSRANLFSIHPSTASWRERSFPQTLLVAFCSFLIFACCCSHIKLAYRVRSTNWIPNLQSVYTRMTLELVSSKLLIDTGLIRSPECSLPRLIALTRTAFANSSAVSFVSITRVSISNVFLTWLALGAKDFNKWPISWTYEQIL